MQNPDNLIWIDLEMTGLFPETDHIIEIATIITDSELNIIAKGPMLAINHPQEIIDGMDEWCQKQHGQSGLIQRMQDSTVSMADAEQQTLEFVQQYVPRGKSPMCGNSICQDRQFLRREMPQLEAWFHYRNYDVSALKEMLGRWSPKSFAGDYQGIPKFEKKGKHLALDDIEDSINELKHYRQYFIKSLD